MQRVLLIPILFFILLSNVTSAYSESIQFPYVPKNISSFPWQLFVLCEGIKTAASDKEAGEKLQAIDKSISFNSIKKTCTSTRQYNITRQLSINTIAQLRIIRKNIYELSEIFSIEIEKFIALNGDSVFQNHIGVSLQAMPSVVNPPDNSPFAAVDRQFSIVLNREPQSLGSLEERFIAGLADFVVERANEESMLYFQEELNENLCLNVENSISNRPTDAKNGNTENNLAKEYFANLCEVFKTGVYGFSLRSVGSYLRTAAKTDLESFPDVAFRHAYLSYRHYKLNPNHLAYLLSL